MSSVNTVALLAPNGRVGAAALKYLLPLDKDGKIKLVLLVRPGSKVSADVGDVPVREVDLDGDVGALSEALQGLTVVISALNSKNARGEIKLVEALSKVPNFGFFMPAAYGPIFSPEEYARPRLQRMGQALNASTQKAKKLGVGVTGLKTGSIDIFFFGDRFVGVDIKANSLQANKDMLANAVPITSIDHVGAALAHLASLPPSQIANKQFSAVTLFATGQDLVEVFTKLHGRPTDVIDYDDQLLDKDNSTLPYGPVQALYKTHWGHGVWEYPEAVPVQEWDGKGEGLEEMAKRFL